jgi:hypothetical protein
MKSIEVEQCDGYVQYTARIKNTLWRRVGINGDPSVEVPPGTQSVKSVIVNAFYLAELVDTKWEQRFEVAAKTGDREATEALGEEAQRTKRWWSEAWDKAHA